MTRSLRFLAAPAGAALLGAGLLAVPGARASAQAAPADGVIYACYVPSTGTVYRIRGEGLPEECGASKVNGRVQPHVPFQWNEQGPAGPPGPVGPQGPAGPAGSGAAIAPTILFSQINIAINPGVVQTFTQTCPTGKRVLDRGYLLLDPGGEPMINPGVTVIGDEYTQPSPSGFDRTPPATQGRIIYIVNNSPRNAQVRMQMTCGTIQ